MSDKLTDCAIEAIGRLESLADNDIDSDYFAVVSNSENGQEVTEEYVITNVAAETAVLIKKLLAALKLEQEQSAYYERHMWDFHGLAESESKRADAAEQRQQKPITLPDRYSVDCGVVCDPCGEWLSLDDVVKVLVDARVEVRSPCPRCNRLLDLTSRPDGAHYCHHKGE
ncbi:hypothetical protein KGP17_11115 [Serratia sp. JSRIV001]|uniref:hypothetical protein n=1 Tax=unclassified Serratia (in: enterobacteria) TaxID=2647522 RepID=UPI001CC189EF|nr:MULTISPECIES: hypothetical protein [unclassified Serratia (in: enterobacteria)]UAN48030.1 hypothetical protein KGP17_11115 [Serratia sp. JSRIV001]UAN53811.1 hypothetical protein KGP26_12470 [Serratia sp. JSRIV002]UAN65136.1 hypothetical protein KGP16_11435 [Serratia sp. JSRIV006]